MRRSNIFFFSFSRSVPTAELTPEMAIQACRAYMHMHFGDCRDNLLLLVDETREASGEDGDGQDAGLVKAMGQILNQFHYHEVNIIASALDNTPFTKEGATGPPIIWCRLDRLPQSAVEDMFLHATLATRKELLHKLPEVPLQVIKARNARLPDTSALAGYLPIEGSTNCRVLPVAVRIAIADCSGHPGTLREDAAGVL